MSGYDPWDGWTEEQLAEPCTTCDKTRRECIEDFIRLKQERA